ncbi:MAG: Uma2 family endonuclease [Bacteroidota bacterium]
MNAVKIKTLDRFTDDEFFEFCQLNDDLHMERDAEGNIIIMDLTGSEGGSFNNSVSSEIYNWNKKEKSGKSFDSSTGFTFPDSSVKGPDAAWIAIERWKALPKEDRKKFAHISPDFVIEIRSESDNLDTLKEKMEAYIKNKVRLAWLIDPLVKQTFVYRINGTIELIPSFDIPLLGEDVLKGFELVLSELLEEED